VPATRQQRHRPHRRPQRKRRTLGDDSYLTIDAANDLAADLHSLGEDEAARQLGQDALARARRAFGDDHPVTEHVAGDLADVLQALAERIQHLPPPAETGL